MVETAPANDVSADDAPAFEALCRAATFTGTPPVHYAALFTLRATWPLLLKRGAGTYTPVERALEAGNHKFLKAVQRHVDPKYWGSLNALMCRAAHKWLAALPVFDAEPWLFKRCMKHLLFALKLRAADDIERAPRALLPGERLEISAHESSDYAFVLKTPKVHYLVFEDALAPFQEVQMNGFTLSDSVRRILDDDPGLVDVVLRHDATDIVVRERIVSP